MKGPKLLLHACCACCATHAIELLERDHEVTAYFYNPNIHPDREYEARLSDMKRLCGELGVGLVEGEYDVKRWFDLIRGHEEDEEGGNRCGICFWMRLEGAAEYAEEHDFDLFTTTLTVSPHKSAERINAIGGELAGRYGVEFLPADLKKKDGFKRSVELSKAHGLRRQDYCGCFYSQRER